MMKNLFLAALLCAACFIQTVLSCSLITTPISKFSDREFIFIGKVTGYTGAVDSPPDKSRHAFQTYGLVVGVKESVFLPVTPKSHFEIFPLNLYADCSTGGYGLENLRKGFPVGSEIRVIATWAEAVPQSADKNVVRLEDQPGSLSSITLNTDENGRSITSPTTVYDYGSYDFKNDRQSLSKHNLPSFEGRKDLLRLQNSTSQNERNSILERLVNIAYVDDLDFYTIFKTYSASAAEADRYYETNLKTFSPEGYTQYITVKNARIELAKMGYKSEDIEKAVQKAMSDGVEFTVEAVVKGTLKHLPEKTKN
jgi:hypothetical protein